MRAIPPTSRVSQRGARKRTCQNGLYFRRQCLIAFVERLCLLREILDLLLRERVDISLVCDKKCGFS